MSSPKTTAKEWDKIREAFTESIMIDTQLTSLAQNLDGADWPMKGKDETPAKYVELTFSEVQEMLALKGQPAERFDQLVTILRETLAFDDPFGDMVEQTAESVAKDNIVLKNLAKLGIPGDFPVKLTALKSDTLEFCRLEKLTTLQEFAVFAQGMSQNVIVGGDFKKLLNALSHVDESALSEVLPFRMGAKGLHLVEALAQATMARDPYAHAEEAKVWFSDEFALLARDSSAPGALARHFVVLGNPALEQKAAALLRPRPRGSKLGQEGKSGFFGALSRLFKK
jgi:hypothetical protein